MAKEVAAAEANRGQRFTPPLSDDERAFYDAVRTNDRICPAVPGVHVG